MPTPNSKAILEQFKDALDTYAENGPGFAVRHVIETNGLTAEDVALAFLVPEALDEQSMMTEQEMKHYEAEKQADEDAKANADRILADEPATAPVADAGEKKPPVGGDVAPMPVDKKKK